MIPQPALAESALAAHRWLAARGIPHALAGTLAGNRYRRPRFTDDVDFLLAPSEALPEEGWTLRDGALRVTLRSLPAPVDLIRPVGFREVFDRAVADAEVVGWIPVLAAGPYALSRLASGLVRDRADLVEGVKDGLLDAEAVCTWLADVAPATLPAMREIVRIAASEVACARRRT